MIYTPSTAENYLIANSYLSVEEAEMLMDSKQDRGNWDNLPVEAKQLILSQASFAVDGVHSYKGSRTTEGQMLKFPRNGSTTIPLSVKYAVAMLAVDYGKEKAFEGITSESIGKMSWTFANSESGVSSEVLSFLKPLKAKSVRLMYR